MLAERESRGRPRAPRLLHSALALLLGLAGAAAVAPSASAVDASTPVQLALAVPITVRPTTTGLLTVEEITEYTSLQGALSRQLDAVIDTPVAIGVDPMIIASIRLLGSSAPPQATEWLSRLDNASNEVFALPYADADVTLATQAGRPTVPGPESFDFAIDPALYSDVAPEPEDTPTPTPSATPTADDDQAPPDDTAPPLPSSDDITAWDYSVTDLIWPRENSVVTTDLAAITSSGYTTTVLSSSNITRDATAGPTIDLESGRALVSDDAVSTALRAAITASTAENWTAAMATLSASLQAANAAQSGSVATVFATFARSIPLGSTRARETIEALSADPSVTTVPLTTALGVPTDEGTVVDQPQDAANIAEVQNIIRAEDEDAQFATVASDPTRVTSERRLATLGVLSSSWRSTPENWAPAVADHLTDSQELRSSVQVVGGDPFNFVSDLGSNLLVDVSNGLDQAVTVYVSVRPSTGALDVDPSAVELIIEPESQGRAAVPAAAVSNGTVYVTATLGSAAGVAIGQPVSTAVNVAAGWETPIAVALAVAVFALFAGGLVRSILKRRRANAEGSAVEGSAVEVRE